MSHLDGIRDKVAQNRFEFSIHALDQSIKRRITLDEFRDAIACGEVIEDYPDDKYGPSCLIFGRTSHDRILHIHVSYPTRDPIKVITLYEPDAKLWINGRLRSKP